MPKRGAQLTVTHAAQEGVWQWDGHSKSGRPASPPCEPGHGLAGLLLGARPRRKTQLARLMRPFSPPLQGSRTGAAATSSPAPALQLSSGVCTRPCVTTLLPEGMVAP